MEPHLLQAHLDPAGPPVPSVPRLDAVGPPARGVRRHSLRRASLELRPRGVHRARRLLPCTGSRLPGRRPCGTARSMAGGERAQGSSGSRPPSRRALLEVHPCRSHVHVTCWPGPWSLTVPDRPSLTVAGCPKLALLHAHLCSSSHWAGACVASWPGWACPPWGRSPSVDILQLHAALGMFSAGCGWVLLHVDLLARAPPPGPGTVRRRRQAGCASVCRQRSMRRQLLSSFIMDPAPSSVRNQLVLLEKPCASAVPRC